jgi:Raf kinase inhibitor-like YbhB/YbcL family protein
MQKALFLILFALFNSQTLYAANFTLTSPQIKPGMQIAEQQVFNGFGCQGSNVSPALEWKGAPAGTKSFALTAYDPDAPTGSGWWHWVIFNIPAATTGLDKGAGDPMKNLAPTGSIQSATDFGKPGYGGPCPPAGDKPHHYQFTIYALKTDKLPLDEKAPAAMVGFYLHQNMIDKAVLEGVYSR